MLILKYPMFLDSHRKSECYQNKCINWNELNVVNAEVSRVFGCWQGNPSLSHNQNESSSHFRHLTTMRRIDTSNIRNRPRSKAIENTPILCDLVLLAGPTDCCTMTREKSCINWARPSVQCMPVLKSHELSTGWDYHRGGIWRKAESQDK